MFDSTNHLVIDLETFGLGPRAMVRSIALAEFNPWSDDEPKVTRYTLLPDEQAGRDIDPRTVLWWMRQPERARRAFTDEHNPRNMWDLAEDLLKKNGAIVWTKPLHCDVPILLDLLRSYMPGIERLDGLLYRRRVHNARTIYEAASLLGDRIDEDPAAWGYAAEELHDPSVDATLTALTVRRALRILRGASTSTGTRRPPRELFVDDDERLVDRV